MIKIAFVYPDFESLGAGYLMAVCRSAGYEPVYVHYEAEDRYTGFVRRHIDYDAVARRIAATGAAVTAFSCVTDNYRHQLACALALKAIAPETGVVFGGIHVTAVPLRVLANGAVDAVAVGEAELSFPRFLESALREGRYTPPSAPVKGMLFKTPAGIVGAVEEGDLAVLDELPFPEKAPFYRAVPTASREYYIMTSRGCPHRCSYCCNSLLHELRRGVSLRRRSVESVIAELSDARRRHKIRFVHFLDDLFTADKAWLRKFSAAYARETGLPFVCNVHPRFVDAETADLLEAAGCAEVQLGVQSLAEVFCRNVLDRRTDNRSIAQAVALFHERGIMVQADHLLGVPGDTLANQEDAARFYVDHRPDIVSVFWLTYYPGTAIVKKALELGTLTAGDINRIEEGIPLGAGGLHDGGSLRDPGRFLGIALVLNYLPLVPKFIGRLLIDTGIYKILRVRSYLLATVLPRLFISLTDRRYFTGRGHLLRFFSRLRPDLRTGGGGMQ